RARTGPDDAEGAPGRVTLNLVATIDFPSEIKALRSTLESIESVSDPEELRAKIADLSEKASAPDLWDDPEAAQKVTSALSAAQSELDRVKKLGQRIDDVETLVEMGQEMDDEDTLVEAENEVAAIRKDLDQLEVRTLLAGEYDAREAVVTIRAEGDVRPVCGAVRARPGEEARPAHRRRRDPGRDGPGDGRRGHARRGRERGRRHPQGPRPARGPHAARRRVRRPRGRRDDPC